ncbi:MAG: DUF1972 domain-containing protein [Clostridium sp.]|jgi:rhamnosyltransferase|uniref:beta 1-4 rhamnosyltransferase Cps2T n=1 Tax=Clostridium TaxID=1485 RepID=UPI0022E67A9B|nr:MULTISPECIES: DUF1972 domain-containing protein [Clostridium]MDU2461177.1 DUF1972 domain-containing protein [Clostridium sp.]MDU4738899.1 DUF1972 domain-containing protein [Clostridium sp.]MDU7949453.1 DUF1972 domain-containing protein [Clostridium sp.]
MKNIFIIGSKGIPAKYGGFETFVEKLTEYKKSEDIMYHVSCLSNNNDEFIYNNARCFNINTPNIGPAKAIYYDVIALKKSLYYIKTNKLNDVVIYILACRIGPFLSYYKKIAENLGVKIYVNPDGHEWKRAKWNWITRKYWKLSEKLMVKNSDLLICDSVNIESYIKKDYSIYNPKTKYIAYGADEIKSVTKETINKLNDWYKEKGISKKSYYLVVGRFVPENNYELMIKEFLMSDSTKSFVLISNVENNKFYSELKKTTRFENDNRIKFVGTVYDSELLQEIRRNAYGYFHGHEVGGTNPSLLEALSTTDLNILLDVNFNREVGRDGAVYFTKEKGSLSKLINKIDKIEEKSIYSLSNKAKKVIESNYTWEKIVSDYEKLFLLRS